MKLQQYLAAAIFAASSALAPATADEPWTPAQDWTDAQQEIIDLLADGPVGIETEFDAWADTFDEDWTVWSVGSRAIRAKGPHMALVRDYVGSKGARVADFQLNPVAVTIRGDTAIVRSYNQEYVVEADGEKRDLHFASVDVLARVDGEWKIVATSIFHMPVPEWAAQQEAGDEANG